MFLSEKKAEELARAVENPNLEFSDRLTCAKNLAKIGDLRVRTLEPVMIDIPGGILNMGSTENEIEHSLDEFSHLFNEFEPYEVKEWFMKEFPKHAVNIKLFRVAKYLVTNGNFHEFQNDSKYTSAHFFYSSNNSNHPVKNITIEEAKLYCEWISNKTGRRFRLLKEEEWEWLARSATYNFRFPW
jgi:toxoflavin biosynthesis protein ToxD